MIQFPKKTDILFKPSRYKVLYGGRGSSKSWSVARALLLLGTSKTLRILCARETQKSIADSVHKLLSDQIRDIEGLDSFYEIQKAIIKGKNGTEFVFSGLKDAASLKSFEGMDICWVEEAQVVSHDSWEKLIPTVRKEGSEIWITFNPEFEDDPTYERFITNQPSNCIIAKMNYEDNPWFPDVLRAEVEALKKHNYNTYLHVWGGECVLASEGAVFNMEWFKRYDMQPRDVIQVVHSWDTAYKKDEHNDPSACTIWHVTDTEHYLMEVVHLKAEYPELRKKILELAERDKPNAILIEDKASGQSLIQELRESTRYPVIAVKPEGDKETRARVSAATIEAGKVRIPERATWLPVFERELMLFPNAKNDDIVDSVSQYINWYNRNGGGADAEYVRLMESLYG